MAQLINLQPLKLNSTQDLFMLAIDHSWRGEACRLGMGFSERRMGKMKIDHCPHSSFLPPTSYLYKAIACSGTRKLYTILKLTPILPFWHTDIYLILSYITSETIIPQRHCPPHKKIKFFWPNYIFLLNSFFSVYLTGAKGSRVFNQISQECVRTFFLKLF